MSKLRFALGFVFFVVPLFIVTNLVVIIYALFRVIRGKPLS